MLTIDFVKKKTDFDKPGGVFYIPLHQRFNSFINNQTNSTMKKFLYATLAVVAVLLFASCKNDKNQPNDQEKADAFISFTFNLPQGGTRAEVGNVAGANAGDTFIGTADEQAIKEVRVVLYDPNEGIVKYALTYNITATGGQAPTGDGLADAPASAATAAQFTTKAEQVVSQDYQMLAIINPTADVIAATAEGKYLKDAQAALESTVKDLSADGKAILMSNDRGLVKVAPADMKAAAADAEGHPIKVNVDRILAKVYVGGTPDLPAGVTFTDSKWELNTTNKKTFIYRQFAQVTTGLDQFAPETVDNNTDRFARYAKDPNYLAGEFNEADFNYKKDVDVLANEWGFEDTKGQYCLENTMDAGQQLNNQTTSFILSGTWKPADHDGISFTKGQTWYSYMGFTFTVAKMKEYIGIVTDASKAAEKEIVGTPAGFKAALKTLVEDANSPVDKTEGTITKSFVAHNFKGYKDGVCYYQTNLIRHFNDAQSSKDMGYGRYGVVRNNIYKVTIKKISQPGEPTIVPEKPNPDDPTKLFVAFDITINPWIVRTQDISL